VGAIARQAHSATREVKLDKIAAAGKIDIGPSVKHGLDVQLPRELLRIAAKVLNWLHDRRNRRHRPRASTPLTCAANPYGSSERFPASTVAVRIGRDIQLGAPSASHALALTFRATAMVEYRTRQRD